jgi:single-strand DNA-binding protein
MNKAILIGNLGGDPEMRYVESGKAVTNFNIATSERWTDGNGKTQEKTTWHRIVVWGKQAENCAKYLAKGRTVAVEGKIDVRNWEDRDGNKRTTTEIVADRVHFLGGGSSAGEPKPSKKRATKGFKSDAEFDHSFSDDDIPF